MPEMLAKARGELVRTSGGRGRGTHKRGRGERGRVRARRGLLRSLWKRLGAFGGRFDALRYGGAANGSASAKKPRGALHLTKRNPRYI